jgi:hypothetical protein
VRKPTDEELDRTGMRDLVQQANGGDRTAVHMLEIVMLWSHEAIEVARKRYGWRRANGEL